MAGIAAAIAEIVKADAGSASVGSSAGKAGREACKAGHVYLIIVSGAAVHTDRGGTVGRKDEVGTIALAAHRQRRRTRNAVTWAASTGS